MAKEKPSIKEGMRRHRKAREREEEPEPAVEQEALKQFATRLPEGLIKEIKLKAVEEETTVQDLVADLLRNSLQGR